MVDLLRLIRQACTRERFEEFVKLAVRCTNDERDPTFPSCTNQIIAYLKGINKHGLALMASCLVDTEQARRQNGYHRLAYTFRDSPSPRECPLM